jgi:hypothetical protein
MQFGSFKGLKEFKLASVPSRQRCCPSPTILKVQKYFESSLEKEFVTNEFVWYGRTTLTDMRYEEYVILYNSNKNNTYSAVES